MKNERADYLNHINELILENTSLKEKLEFHELFMENSNSWETFRDKAGKILYISPNFDQITGYDRNDYLNDKIKFIDFVFPDDKNIAIENFQKQIDGQQLRNFICRIYHKNNSLKYISLSSKPVFNKQNEYLGFRTSIIDVTDQKKAEQLIKESEERLKKIFERHNAIMLLIDPHSGLIIDANDAAASFYGYSKTVLCSMTIDEINTLPPEQIIKERENAVSERRNYFNFTHLLANGKERMVEVHSSPIDFQDKKLLFSIIHDITDKKKAEQDLIDSEEKYKSIVETALVGIGISKGLISVYSNKVLLEIFGYSENEVLNKPFLDFFHSDDRPVIIDRMKRRSQGEKLDTNVQMRIVRKNGEIRYIYLSVSAFFLNDEQFYQAIIVDVSEKILAEQALKVSEERFRLISDLTSDYIFVSKLNNDGQLELEYTMGALEKLTGYTEDEFKIPGKWHATIHPDDIEIDNRDLQKLLNNEKVISELRTLHKNGSIKWMQTYAHPIWDEKANKLIGIEGAVQDITARKLAELDLKDNRARFNLIADYSYNWEVFRDNKGNLIYSSPAFERITGYSNDDYLAGKVILKDFIHPNDFEYVIKTFQDATKGEKIPDLEFRIITKDGNTKFVAVSVWPVFVDNNMFIGFRASIRNITRRKLAENAIKENEQRLHSLVNIFRFDADTIPALFDFTLEEAIKLTSSKIGYINFYDEDKQEFTQYSWSKEVMAECKVREPKSMYQLDDDGICCEVVRQRNPVIVNDYKEYDAIKKDLPEGHVTIRKIMIIPVIVENRNVAVIGVANKETDYNETDALHLKILMDNVWKLVLKKERDELIKCQNLELQKLNADKDLFISILAHDLKNPFNSILGFLELLIENIHKYDIDKIEKMLGIVNNSAKNTYDLLLDLLSWSKAQSGSLAYDPQKFVFADICQNVVDNLNLHAKNKNITINLFGSEQIKVYADYYMLNAILRNLITNAIKFTKSEGQIKIYYEINNANVEVSVVDNGIGIAPDRLKKLFDITQKITTSGTANETGTGLGLVLCKEFVEKHGGKIWVESKIGSGSSFKFTLPLCTD